MNFHYKRRGGEGQKRKIDLFNIGFPIWKKSLEMWEINFNRCK